MLRSLITPAKTLLPKYSHSPRFLDADVSFATTIGPSPGPLPAGPRLSEGLGRSRRLSPTRHREALTPELRVRVRRAEN